MYSVRKFILCEKKSVCFRSCYMVRTISRTAKICRCSCNVQLLKPWVRLVSLSLWKQTLIILLNISKTSPIFGSYLLRKVLNSLQLHQRWKNSRTNYKTRTTPLSAKWWEHSGKQALTFVLQATNWLIGSLRYKMNWLLKKPNMVMTVCWWYGMSSPI